MKVFNSPYCRSPCGVKVFNPPYCRSPCGVNVFNPPCCRSPCGVKVFNPPNCRSPCGVKVFHLPYCRSPCGVKVFNPPPSPKVQASSPVFTRYGNRYILVYTVLVYNPCGGSGFEESATFCWIQIRNFFHAPDQHTHLNLAQLKCFKLNIILLN